ncbi:MAG: NUDIX hydrolase [Nanoarchaeota archaeon]|nr:NUDIX hydrolase [Nanoarchaeota archaeon]
MELFLDQTGKKVIKPPHIIPKSRNSCYALITKNDRILAVKNRWTQDIWSLPGGCVEEGETISEGLKREVLEETGIIIDFEDVIIYSTQQNFYAKDQDIFFYSKIRVFLIDSFQERREDFTDKEEIIDKLWLPIQEISNDNFHPNHFPAIELLRQKERLSK